MLIFTRQAALSEHLAQAAQNLRIGFVPTMGALHSGHLSLLRESLANNQVTVLSIFVNPTQFNNQEDLQKYPRTLESDIEKVSALSGDIVIFAPNVEDVYPDEALSESFEFDGLEEEMEGKFRKGHFDGVATIVRRLFEIVKPTNAYFGEKDFQQLQIVRKLVEKLGLPVRIVGCPIYREENGLAMSSRNERLTAQQRSQASVIYSTLLQAKQRFGSQSLEKIAEFVTNCFKDLNGFELEYFTVADEQTLRPAARKEENKKYRAFIAVFVNNIRLIDTIALN